MGTAAPYFRNHTVLWMVVLLLAVWFLVFLPILPKMVETWFSHSDNSHALLVPFISLYFLWTKRSQIASAPIESSAWGGLVLVVSLALYLVGYMGGIKVLARLMMVTSLIGLVWCCLGGRILQIAAFPLAFLFFMVPVPVTLIGMVSFPLKLFATKVSADLISFFSIPIIREGNMLFFVQAQLEVAEACSGIRSIMSLTMLSVIFAYLLQGGGWLSRSFLVLSAIPIALIANIFRVTGTGALAHFYGDRVARGFLHEFSGMIVFAFGFLLLFLIFMYLQRRLQKVNDS